MKKIVLMLAAAVLSFTALAQPQEASGDHDRKPSRYGRTELLMHLL